MGVMGCGSYSGSSNPATAVLTANSSNLVLGESVFLDASSSNFDTLQWFSNGTSQIECIDQSACVLAPQEIGSYQVSIESKVKGENQSASNSLVIQVVGSPAAVNTSNAGLSGKVTKPY